MKVTKNMQTAAFTGNLERHEKLLAFLQLAFMLLACAAFLCPALIARYGNSYYYVRGIDMVFGQQVPGDKYGMVPQTSIALGALILVLGALAWLLVRNKDKAAFVGVLCGAVSLVLLFLPLVKADEKVARTDPIVEGMLEGRFQYGYYLVLACIGISVAAGVLRCIARPAMRTDLIRHAWIYAMALPVFIYVLIFFYYPMYGTILAFKDYVPRLGILGSPWVGFDNFVSFFESAYFGRLLRNTLVISGLTLIFNFVAPIIFALFLNEIRSTKLKRTVQTATYLPHFISIVVVCGLLTMFLSKEGLVNQLLLLTGMSKDQARNLLANPDYFRAIYVISDVWQKFGWGSIVYIAAITNIDSQLYEAAAVDGAGRFRRMWSVTLPGIAPTAIIMLIMAVGGLMNLGHEKIILLYNPQTYVKADVIASFVYRRGIVENNYSFATAVGLFNTAINFVLVMVANKISKTVSETRLW